MRFCFVGFSFVVDILLFACVLVKKPRDIGYLALISKRYLFFLVKRNSVQCVEHTQTYKKSTVRFKQHS